MIIDLRPITDIPRHFELRLDAGWWESSDVQGQVPGLDGPLCARINIARAGSKFILEGSFSGRLLMTCDRCLEPYGLDIKNDFKVFVTRRSNPNPDEEELEAEDLEDHFVKEDEIDLAETIREQVFLSLPMKSLCGENCLGLCPACGANLNHKKCGCTGSSEDKDFSMLKNLRIKQGE
jgi:uncharacterized protein